MKTKKLVIFGDSAFAEIAYEYFTHDSDYQVVAFTVTKDYLKNENLFGLPVVAFEDIQQAYPPEHFEMHVALVYNTLNRVRAKFYHEAKLKGYRLANYVSSRAFVWHNVTMGDNVFIFEDNTVQPFVVIGSNVVFWSGNHIGHHSKIGSHNFLSSHVVVSGFCEIQDYCFMGVNSTIGNNIVIGKDSLIGSGALITKDVPKGSFVYGNRTLPADVSTYSKFGIDEVD